MMQDAAIVGIGRTAYSRESGRSLRAQAAEAARAALVGASLCALGWLGCASPAPVILDCAPAGELTPICGAENPEDLVAVPGSDWLIVSQMAGREGAPGTLAALRPGDSRWLRLYPLEGPTLASPAESFGPRWGDPSCPGPPTASLFSPHGIDLVQHSAEAPILLVVNHGGRESVEFFELAYPPTGEPALRWRGCALLPAGTLPNDVAALPGAGFAVTNMAPAREGLSAWWSGLRMALGFRTGNVLEWQPGAGWREVEGSESSGPNGIAAARGGATLFIAEYGSGRIQRVARRGGRVARSAPLAFKPDNLSWSEDGQLLAAGQSAPLSAILGCFEVEAGSCGLPFGVAALDPDSLAVLRRFDHAGTTGIGAVTLALSRGERIYLGTFRGDRVAWIPSSALRARP